MTTIAARRPPIPAHAAPALTLRSATKRYGAVTAVAGLDLELPTGTCLGLLGPNGAGKSTTMRLLTAQSHADEGQIEVLGFRLPRDAKQARAQMGVVPQQDNLDTELTARQNLAVFARLYRVPRADRATAVDQALELAHLADRADTKVNKLSGGMRRRLLIARGLVHRPRLVLLDEPTVGLDPQVRQELWALIDRLRNEGSTVLMSTHYIEEAERLADDVALMSHGALVARGNPGKLINEYAGSAALEFYAPPDRLLEIEQRAHGLTFPTRRSGPAVCVLRAESLPSTFPEGLPSPVRRAPSLEDVFVLLTGERVE